MDFSLRMVLIDRMKTKNYGVYCQLTKYKKKGFFVLFFYCQYCTCISDHRYTSSEPQNLLEERYLIEPQTHILE